MNVRDPQYIYYALAAMGVGLGWWLFIRHRVQARHRQFLAEKPGFWTGAKGLLLVLATSWTLFCLSGPTWGSAAELVYSSGRDIYFVMDSSYSMLAEDVAPSRLQAAKFLALSLVKELPGARYGLIAFAGNAFPACPLTHDRDLIRTILANVHPDNLSSQGTDFQSPLTTLERIIRRRDPLRRLTILFLSDGESFESPREDTLRGLQATAAQFIAIGVGTPEGAFLKDPRTQYREWILDREGRKVISRLQRENLNRLTDTLDGIYVDLRTAGITARNLLDHHLRTRTAGEFVTVQRPINRGHQLALLSVCLLGWVILPDGKGGRTSPFRLMGLLVICLLPLGGCTPPAMRHLRAGNELLQRAEYPASAVRYRQALQALEENEPLYATGLVNLSAALALGADRRGLQQLLAGTAEAPAPGPTVPHLLYNQGCGEMLVGANDSAREAFRRCLEMNPLDEAARWNLELLEDRTPEKPPVEPPPATDDREQAERLLDSVRDREKTYLPPQPKRNATPGGPYW
ncbi:MAG: VWA domain-containing protein [Acidobacteria bacterium]|nr:VWA domain-containing protein [Acidobacteriota bacterium]